MTGLPSVERKIKRIVKMIDERVNITNQDERGMFLSVCMLFDVLVVFEEVIRFLKGF